MSRPSRALRAPWRSASGQAAVELVGMLPVYGAVVLAIAHVLVAAVTRELAGHAAEAAAIAQLRGEDPKAAARAALPGWSRKELTVKVSGRRVSVRVAPPALVPGAGDALASTVTADAGPS